MKGSRTQIIPLSLIHISHSPEQTLRRGYALVENQDKQLIRQTNQVHAGEKLKIRVSDG